MTPEELQSEWEEGESPGMRPARVQAVRDDLMRVTGRAVPRRIPDIEAMLADSEQRGLLTRRLREAAGVYEEAEPDHGDGDDG